MHCLMICGSWGLRSANAAVLDIVEGRLLTHGTTVDRFDQLTEISPFEPALVDDAPPAVEALRARIAAADLVVIAAPEYAGAVSGTVKNALDWMVGSASFSDAVVGVASAGTTGGHFARRDLAQTLGWHGALVVAHVGVAAPRTKSDGAGRIVDTATIDAIDRFTDGLVDLVTRPRPDRLDSARAVATELGIDAGRVQ